MKKTIFLITLTALLCSCAAKPAETTATPADTAPAETTITTAAAAEPVQTTPETDRGERLTVNTDAFYNVTVNPENLYFYKNDADTSFSEYYYKFDYTYGFVPSVYDDSTLHPERFDRENYDYTPETEYVYPEVFRIGAGDTVGGYRIRSAETTIVNSDMVEYGGNAICATEIILDGEYSFTGVLRFFYDEDYAITAGDLQFLPTEPLTDFPLPLGYSAHTSFFNENTAVYSELMNGFRTGNFFTEESGAYVVTDEENHLYEMLKFDDAVLAELTRMLSGETNDCEKRVEVTLSGINLVFNDQTGSMGSKAVITAIKEIK